MYKIKCSNCNPSVINDKACHEIGCTGYLTFSKLGRDYYKYNVYTLDVWGNDKEGFEVNNRFKCGTVLIPAECDDHKIIERLKLENYLNKRAWYSSFTVDGDDNTYISVDWKDGYPLLQLEIQ